MTEERIVPVKCWLRPGTYRALHQHAQRRGIADVGEMLAQIADLLVRPTTAPKRKRRALKYSSTELEQRRLERQRAFASDATDPRHGNHNGYVNLGCRCERCREAAAAYATARRTR